MTFLTLDRVACTAPDGTSLFTDLSFSLGREVVGLVGRNGAGKSTLLRAIAGDLAPASGTIARPARIGMLGQFPEDPGVSVAAAFGLAEHFARLDRIESGQFLDEDIELADWSLPERFAGATLRAGLPGLDPERTLDTFSGGQRTRLMLTGVLLDEPDVLLLDEPTNNLDAQGRQLVIDLLRQWNGGAIVASHDRELLGHVDRIIEVTGLGAHIVSGGWDAFSADRNARVERAEALLQQGETALRKARREVQEQAERKARRDGRGKREAAKGSQPRVLLGKRKERAEASAGQLSRQGEGRIEEAADELATAKAQIEILVPIRITLPKSGLAANRTLIAASGIVAKGAAKGNDATLFGPLDLTLKGPERLRIAGANGSGKSTLLRIFAGIAAPAQGKIMTTKDESALLDQHVSMLGDEGTLVDAIRLLQPDASLHHAHEALAAYGFRGTWGERDVASLSGGERMRLALCALFTRPRPPVLLLLDEPTNHLDIEAAQMLETALSGYDGALVCISHDEAFCEGIGLDRTITLGC